ncbi:hypothetical protein AFLA_002493 [Aspergillus flavus NRRL3357]|nr:hypothetical protein AFLA_002493 [Aspergillus flavus NRRL3357]
MRQMVSFPSWGSWAFLQVYARGFADADKYAFADKITHFVGKICPSLATADKAETENQVADKLGELGPLLYRFANAFSSKRKKKDKKRAKKKTKYQKDAAAAAAPNAPSAVNLSVVA